MRAFRRRSDTSAANSGSEMPSMIGSVWSPNEHLRLTVGDFSFLMWLNYRIGLKFHSLSV